MRLKYIFIPVVVLLVWMHSSAQVIAAQVYPLHYYESSYTFLKETTFQFYAFAPLEGELITVVVYGINPDEGVQPIVSVYGPNYSELTADLNSDGNSVALVQFVAPSNGVYLIAVSRLGIVPGSVRVMLFEGEPLDYDISLLDTGAPVLPDRAFLVAGDTLDPIDLSTYIWDDNFEEMQHRFFASRADEYTPAPLSERQTPVEGVAWVNDDGETFYTLNVASNTELDVSRPDPNRFAFPDSTFYDFIVQIGSGSEEPVRVNRPICIETIVSRTVPTRIAPDPQAFVTGYIPENSFIEIVAVNPTEDWVQIMNPNHPTGQSWIPRQSYFDLTDPNCNRVGVNGSHQSSWPYVRLAYEEALRTIQANPTGVIISLGFSCSNLNEFGAAYQAIQNQLGGWLPALSNILQTLYTVSCTRTGSSPSSSGDGSVIVVDDLDDPIFGTDTIVTTVPLNCTTTIFDTSPAGGISNHFTDDFTGTDDCDVVFGNDNPNLILGMGGNDTLRGYGGDDTLQGGDGNDAINAGAGNDLVAGGSGNDILDGDVGNDTYDASDSGVDQDINLDSGFALAGTDIDILLNIENIRSGSGHDMLNGDSSANIIEGGDGDDSVHGGGGNDTLLGEAGNDDLFIEGSMGNSSLNGGTGYNLYRVMNGATGDVTLTGNGDDTLDFSDYGLPIRFNMDQLNTPQDMGGGLFLTLTNVIRNLIGTIYGDELNGSTDGDLILGGDGDDTVNGLDGDDDVYGEGGSDLVVGGDGTDNVFGGWRNEGVHRDDYGMDTVEGGSGDLDLVVGGNHNFNGGSGNDGDDLVLDLTGEEELLIGGNYNSGGDGDDGNDTLIDTAGDDDTLYGGNFNTNGGNGSDGNDSIVDMLGNFDNSYGGNRNEPGSNGDDGDDTVTDMAGNDDQIFGGNRNQTGSSGNDGNDSLTDVAGNRDRVFGGNFNESGATGHDGNDTIVDQAGNRDQLHGGNLNGSGGTGNDGNDSVHDQAGGNDGAYGGNYNLGGTGNDNQGGGSDTVNTNDAGSDIVSGGNLNQSGGTGTDGTTDVCISNPSDTVNATTCP